MVLYYAILVVIALVAAFILFRGGPTGWTASTNGNSYGARVEADGSFNFPASPNGVHYVTKACSGLSGKQIRLRYRIDGGPFYPSSNPAQSSIGPTVYFQRVVSQGHYLYFQRKNDDWSGMGEYDGYRWFATFASPSPITPGG